MKKLYFLFSLVFFAFAVKAQQPLFLERAYVLSPATKMFRTGTVFSNGQLLLAGPTAVQATPTGGWQNRYMLLNPTTLDTLWTRKGALMSDVEQDIRLTSDQGFISAYTMKRTTSPKYIIQLQKLRSNGSVQWIKPYTNAIGGALSVSTLPDNGYLISGSYGQNKSFSFIRTDSLGNVQGYKDYSRNGQDYFVQMAKAANGNFLAVGRTSYPYPKEHIKAVLVNANGDSIKALQLIVNGFDRREALSATGIGGVIGLSDGGFLINAYVDTMLSTRTAYMAMLVKLDANLNIMWKYVDRSNLPNLQIENAFHKMQELTDGSILTLTSQIAPNTTNQFYLYRFSPNGLVMNVFPFTSAISSRLSLYTFNALPDSSFVVAGLNKDINITSNYGYYAARIKLPGLKGRITATKPDLAAAGFTLGQSYPNPATESAIIPFHLPNSYKQATILIRDITGREVGNYAIKKHSSSLEVSLNNFSNGLYTYTLLVDEKPVATKKLSVIR